MSEDSCESAVKASVLIEALNAGGIEGRIADQGDAAPCLQSVSIEVDDNHRCSLTGHLAYREDDVKSCINDGKVVANVMGVVFTRSFIYEDYEIEIDEDSGREIEYDGDLTEEDVLEAAEAGITFPSYDADDFPFDEEDVTDQDIIDALEWFGQEFEAFALDRSGAVCAFESEDDVPEIGFSIISEEEAFAKLAEERPGISYDF